MDQRLSRGGARAGPQGTCMALTGPSHPSSPPWPYRLSKVGSLLCGGWVGMSRGPRNWWPAPQSQGPEELSSCWVLHVGVRLQWPQSFRGHKKMLRARASEQAEGAQLTMQSWNGLPGTGRLDRIRAHWISWSLPLDMLGTGARPEPGLDTEQPEAPADAGAAQGDSSLYCPSHAEGQLKAPRAVAMLPGLGLAQCGPARPRG